MSYLIVVAHPDDEILGVGATIVKLKENGEKVFTCIMSSAAAARKFRPDEKELNSDLDKAAAYIGIDEVFRGDFPNIKMNTVPHLELVQFIEKIIIETGATNVITHHPYDLNNDHRQTSLACQAAVRLFQRIQGVPRLKELMYMEVLSSTDWAFNNSSNSFSPNVFFEVGMEKIEKKIEALKKYRGVMREYPHPRSIEAIKGLAAYRGAQAGIEYAESFQCAFLSR